MKKGKEKTGRSKKGIRKKQQHEKKDKRGEASESVVFLRDIPLQRDERQNGGIRKGKGDGDVGLRNDLSNGFRREKRLGGLSQQGSPTGRGERKAVPVKQREKGKSSVSDSSELKSVKN